MRYLQPKKLENCEKSVRDSEIKISETSSQNYQKIFSSNWKPLPKYSLRTNSNNTLEKQLSSKAVNGHKQGRSTRFISQVETAQMVSAIGKGAAQLRKAERRASELYNEIRYIFEEGGDEQTMSTILEKTRRLTVYCLATGTELDRDTKYLSIKELRLPDSLKYLEGDDEDDSKDLFFPLELFLSLNYKTRCCFVLQQCFAHVRI